MQIKPKILRTALSERELDAISEMYEGNRTGWVSVFLNNHLELIANLFYLYRKKRIPEKVLKQMMIDEIGESTMLGKTALRSIFNKYENLLTQHLRKRGVKI